MGSSNRDYMQDSFDSGQGQPAWAHDVPTTKWLIVATVLIFFLESFFTHGNRVRDTGGDSVALAVSHSRLEVSPAQFGGMGPRTSYILEWFGLEANKVLHGQVWRLASYIFCHNRYDPFSLVLNMVMLWFIGSNLERMYGSREMLWFYVAAGVACGLIFTAFAFGVDLPVPMLGCWPSVMALLTLYATHFPRQEILFCWFIPIQIRILLIIYVAISLYGIAQAFAGDASWASVAYTSQLWGIAFGYAYRKFGWHLSGMATHFDLQRWQRSLRRASTARTLKVYHPEPASNLDEQVDAILIKIHEQGSESLTERERAILQKASEQAKNKM